MPLNVMDAHFRSFAQLVVPHLVGQQIGVLGMKTFGGADGVILKSKTVEPLECLHYSLNLPTSVVITGIDSQRILDQAFEAVKSFHLMDDEAVSAIIAKTASAGAAGTYELFKTSSIPPPSTPIGWVATRRRCRSSPHRMPVSPQKSRKS